jgi:riboflavin kinase/FMN adenylyltransferase
MQRLFRNLNELPESIHGGAISIGNFDGVHRGHRALLARLIAMAKSLNGPATVFTFDPSPVAILSPNHAPPILTTMERRAELLWDAGVDFVIAYPADRSLFELSAEEFFQQFIRQRLGCRGIVEGPNFRFGKDRLGDVELLELLCREASIQSEIVTPIQTESALISSSRIRQSLSTGDIAAANAMLATNYQVTGQVVGGAKRGRKLGFPTANLSDVRTLLPADGVYGGKYVRENQSYKAAIHIGPNPTFGESSKKTEVHLLDFSGDLYGQQLTVSFQQRVRGIETFSSKQALLDQIELDLTQIRSQDD